MAAAISVTLFTPLPLLHRPVDVFIFKSLPLAKRAGGRRVFLSRRKITHCPVSGLSSLLLLPSFSLGSSVQALYLPKSKRRWVQGRERGKNKRDRERKGLLGLIFRRPFIALPPRCQSKTSKREEITVDPASLSCGLTVASWKSVGPLRGPSNPTFNIPVPSCFCN